MPAGRGHPRRPARGAHALARGRTGRATTPAAGLVGGRGRGPVRPRRGARRDARDRCRTPASAAGALAARRLAGMAAELAGGLADGAPARCAAAPSTRRRRPALDADAVDRATSTLLTPGPQRLRARPSKRPGAARRRPATRRRWTAPPTTGGRACRRTLRTQLAAVTGRPRRRRAGRATTSCRHAGSRRPHPERRAGYGSSLELAAASASIAAPTGSSPVWTRPPRRSTRDARPTCRRSPRRRSRALPGLDRARRGRAARRGRGRRATLGACRRTCVRRPPSSGPEHAFDVRGRRAGRCARPPRPATAARRLDERDRGRAPGPWSSATTAPTQGRAAGSTARGRPT